MKRKKSNFFIVLSIVIASFCLLIFSSYLIIDMVLVPKYFSKYNINNLRELINVATTMYSVPDEKNIIKNGYSKKDEITASEKLVSIGFPTTSTGEVDYSKLIEPDFTVVTKYDYEGDYLALTDKEAASIMSKILESGILIPELSNLSNLDTLNMTVREMTFSNFDKENYEKVSVGEKIYNVYDKVTISSIIKIDMSSAISQMSKSVDMPLFLLNILVPKAIYLQISFDAERNLDNEWITSNANLAINGKTVKQSEIVLNLFISFIYSGEDEMTIEKLANELATMSVKCFNTIGDLRFSDNISSGHNKENGAILSLNKEQSPDNETIEEQSLEDLEQSNND